MSEKGTADCKSGQNLSPAQAYAIGSQRESWCAVEKMKEEDWCRATRKHYSQQFKSNVFSSSEPAGGANGESRCTFSVNTPTHRERRHFPITYDNQLKL